MAARTPRLRFSTPFVVTLAATVPLTACIVHSSGGSSGPRPAPAGQPVATGEPGHDHDHDHAGHGDHRPPVQNPPGTDPSSPTPTTGPRPPTQNPTTGGGTKPPTTNPPTQNPTTGGGTKPPNPNPPTNPGNGPTWNPPPPTPTPTTGGGKPPTQKPPVVVPPTTDPAPNPTPTLPSTAATWTVVRRGEKCTAAIPVKCPEPTTPGGVRPTCNPPPPMAFACPPKLADNASVNVSRKQGETDCTVDEYFPECGPNMKCKKMPSYKTACPTR